jgi:hypothetical protein
MVSCSKIRIVGYVAIFLFAKFDRPIDETVGLLQVHDTRKKNTHVVCLKTQKQMGLFFCPSSYTITENQHLLYGWCSRALSTTFEQIAAGEHFQKYYL